MARLQTFDRDIRLATAGLAPEVINAELAELARAELGSAIASGEGSPIYEKFVNGRAGAAEESVKAPGPILYQFSWWPEIVEFGLEFLRKRSPVRSGRYRDSWFAMLNGARIADYDAIPLNATVTLTNDQPYSRKIEVGHMRMSVPPGVAEAGRQAIRRQYGAILDVQRTMITLPGGYILKGHFGRGIGPHARTSIRRDTEAGAQMTYPAVLMQLRA